jgi:hypothetical protein
MIALRSDCLVFQLNNGQNIPCSPEMIAVEIVGDAHQQLEPETLRHAAASVFHYFKTELAREAVTVGEFSLALEKALHHLGYDIRAHEAGEPVNGVSDGDLTLLASEASGALELLFFPRLRDELRVRLRQSPRVVRFRGLRSCVKQLMGVRRWTSRCEQLQDQIVDYLRGCLTAEPAHNCALVVE